MALDGDALGTVIKNTLLALNPDSGLLNGAEETELEDYWQAVANDFEDHYEAFMDVLPGTFITTDAIHDQHGAQEPVTGIGTVT